MMAADQATITISSMLQYLHIGELLIFSFCLILIQIKTRAAYIWVGSNIVALIGSTYTLTNFQFSEPPALSGALILISASIKCWCFADRSLLRQKNRLPSIFLSIGVFIAFVVFLTGESNYRLFLVAISGIFLCLSAAFYINYNKQWVGLASVKYFMLVLAMGTIGSISLLSVSFPIGSATRFMKAAEVIPFHILILTILIFFFHMAFISLVVGRQARLNMFQLRKSIRIAEGINQAQSREKESTLLAEERYHLVKMLTHEVRQPMNSAQAALQTLTLKITSGAESSENIKRIIESAGATLNSIVLSISNSILGATLIAKGRTQILKLIDVCCVVELALLDIDRLEAVRIEKKFEQPVMFADADPIILRLGTRNLLENAVKYSPRQSKIFLNVDIDEENLTVVISVTNSIESSAMLASDILNQSRRGVDKKYEGFGLGLYIVKEVAKLHQGSLGFNINDGKTVTFQLSLPA